MKREEIVDAMAMALSAKDCEGSICKNRCKCLEDASDALTALEAAGYAVVHIAGQELAKHWDDFCDGDRRDIPDGFEDRMIDAGLVDFREVEASDLDNAFAHERGIEEGGMIYVLTKQGRAMIAAAEVEDE